MDIIINISAFIIAFFVALLFTSNIMGTFFGQLPFVFFLKRKNVIAGTPPYFSYLIRVVIAALVLFAVSIVPITGAIFGLVLGILSGLKSILDEEARSNLHLDLVDAISKEYIIIDEDAWYAWADVSRSIQMLNVSMRGHDKNVSQIEARYGHESDISEQYRQITREIIERQIDMLGILVKVRQEMRQSLAAKWVQIVEDPSVQERVDNASLENMTLIQQREDLLISE